MKKKFLSVVLSATMVAGMLTACGNTAATAPTSDAPAAEATDATAETPAADTTAVAADEGKVLNIYCWNDEFQRRVKDHYPGYTEVDATTGTIGDVTVKWNITPNQDNAYQNNLDENLLKQADAAADDKIDIFLVEADYALKYVDEDVTLPVADLGITDADIADQDKYTKCYDRF